MRAVTRARRHAPISATEHGKTSSPLVAAAALATVEALRAALVRHEVLFFTTAEWWHKT